METRLFNKQQLNDFVHSDYFNRLSRIPISRHRAVSQANNPRASEKDILLVAMFEKDLLIGYLGVLPDYVFNEDQCIRVGWLSCFWVDEAYRSQSIAATIFLHIMEAWEGRILITNFVPSLSSLYRRTGMFAPEMVKIGIRAYLRFNLAEILPPKKRWFNSIRPLLTISDYLFNIVADRRFLFHRKYTNIKSYRFINNLDDATAAYIASNIGYNWPRRSQSDLLWIMKYPWIREKSVNDQDIGRYYFSSASRRFCYKLIILLDDKQNMCGLAMICIRNNHVTVPYIFGEGQGIVTLGRVITDYMVLFRLNMITIYDQRLIKAMQSLRRTFLFQKRILKPYFVSKKLSFISRLNFQDGDGDCVFY